MALIVEDGTVVANADAYVSVADTDTYHTNRGNTLWTGAVGDKEAAIRKATDYIDKRFGLLFRGIKSSSQQELQWPRIDAYDNSGYTLAGIVPTQLKKAVYEYALRALVYNVLAPDAPLPSPQQSLVTGVASATETNSGVVSKKTEKVGPLEETTQYTEGTSGSDSDDRVASSGLVNGWRIPEYPEADLWLSELTRHQFTTSFARA